mgnify:CR=1 FL=1
MYNEVKVINNLKVNYSKASNKAFGKRGNGPLVDGKSWHEISQFGNMLRSKTKNIELCDYFQMIYKNTDIRIVELQIDGSHDDGGIEGVTFYDENADELGVHYETMTLQLRKNYQDETKQEWDISGNKYDSRQQFESIFDQRTDIESSQEFFAYVSRSLLAVNELHVTSENNAWIVHDINTQNRIVNLFRFVSKPVEVNYLPGAWHSNTLHGVLLQWPGVDQKQWSGIESHAYSQLTGGWEINEGSSNTIQYKIVEQDDADLKKNPKFDIEVNVEQNQNVVDVNTYETASLIRSDHRDKLFDFVRNELKIKPHDERTLDFNIKKDREKIYQLVEFFDNVGRVK